MITTFIAFYYSQILNVHNVLVVVSRWYGGILLGPDRFKHINNCARNVLVEHDYVPSTVGLIPPEWRHLHVNLCDFPLFDEARRKVIELCAWINMSKFS